MKNFIVVAFFLLGACTATPAPVIETTSTPLPLPTRVPPTAVPPSPTETIVPPPTVPPTEEFVTERVSSIDGMPEIHIPAGMFRMGGMDVRRAPNEIPEHNVTLEAFWMDQLEVTNAMYGLCVSAGGC